MRGGTGYGRTPGVAVYVNGQLYGDVKSLSSVQKELVERITYLSIAEAQQRYSTGQFQPVIDIRLIGGGT